MSSKDENREAVEAESDLMDSSGTISLHCCEEEAREISSLFKGERLVELLQRTHRSRPNPRTSHAGSLGQRALGEVEFGNCRE